MDDHTLYTELKKFTEGPLWNQVLRPRMQEWVDRKRAGIESAATQSELWDARTRAQTAAEGLAIIDDAFTDLKRRLASEREPAPVT